MSLNDLSFGEEFCLEEETQLGQKDEVAIFLCALCGLGTVAACIACGCEIPIAFGLGVSVAAELGGGVGTAAGTVAPA